MTKKYFPTAADVKAGYNLKTGKAFTAEETATIEETGKQAREQWGQIQSTLANALSQLKVTIEAQEKMFADAFVNLNENLSKEFKKTFEPVRLMFVAKDLYDALKTGECVTVTNIMASPDFGVHLLQLLVRWTEMNEEERTEELKQKKNEAEKLINKIKSGSQMRQDQIDAEVLKSYFKKKNHTIRNSAEFDKWPFDDWPLTNNYEPDSYKKWYKEAMPHVKLSGGRPKKQK
ncbi:hypothetical protein [Undibacterium sp. SXout20W]|uniref:hypothetical protein n=1 Tax=Undibacterium sp. SXout20W TaxID=3413051 RepID=UPI003BF14606